MDPLALCRLVDGDIEQWTGLGRLSLEQLPSCLGTFVERGTVRFRLALLAVDTFQPPTGSATVHVYWAINGSSVELVDVLPGPTADPATRLGEPAAKHVYALEERAAAGLSAPPGGSIEELIYDRRGLAIAVGRDAGGVAQVLRVRGFQPMPATEYVNAYVRFEYDAL